jgi:hypothetical protein
MAVVIRVVLSVAKGIEFCCEHAPVVPSFVHSALCPALLVSRIVVVGVHFLGADSGRGGVTCAFGHAMLGRANLLQDA